MNIEKKIVEAITPTRIAILRMFKDKKHPEEIAKVLNITRQAVDKHLSILYALGLVDKEIAVKNRPMVFYTLTPEGEEFIQNFEDLVENHILNMRKRYKQEIFNLDQMLVNGEISEKEYKEKRNALNKRLEWVNE